MVEVLFPPAPLPDGEKLFVRQCVDTLVSLTELYGFDSKGFKRIGTYNHWLYLAAASGDAMKLCKYKLAAFYSFWKAQELPDSPFPEYLDNASIILGSRGYRFIRSLSREHPRSFESYITSVLYSKKGMPRPGKWRLHKAEADAFAKLTTKPHLDPYVNVIPWGDVEEYEKLKIDPVVDRDSMSHQLRRTVRELFRGVEYTSDDRIEPFFPSTSANYINTRALGGAVGVIMGDPKLLDGLRTDEALIDVNVVGNQSKAVIVDSVNLRSRFLILYNRIMAKASMEVPTAIPLALAEALKTRVISKGPPLAYTALKPLQRKMWSVLKKHPAFKLVGQPVDTWYVQERMGAKLKLDEAFLSVDYSDATNEMYSWVSDVVVDEISTVLNLTEQERVLFKRILTGHLIEFEEEILPQERGQLMGSIVSFPVLCIVNAACCRWAQELAYKRRWTLSDCRFGVNGDDGILRTTGFGKLCWEKISSFCGLKPSVGKVYFSREFLNINSTTYNFHPDGHSCDLKTKRVEHFELIRYVNLGLLFNLQRSGSGKAMLASDREGTLGSRVRELIRLCPEDMQEVVLKRFIHLNNETLSSLRIPWFIPEDLGGMGLPCVGRFKACDKDLRLARMIHDHPSQFVIPSRPKNSSWHVWEYATKRFTVNPADVVMSQHGPDLMSGSRLRGLFCVEALFRSDFAKLYREEEAKSYKRYWNSLRRIWEKACHSGIPFPEPFSPDNYPKKYDINEIPYLIDVSRYLVSTRGQNVLSPEKKLRLDQKRIGSAAPVLLSKARVPSQIDNKDEY